MMMYEADEAKREAWMASIGTIAALNPKIVVAGHKSLAALAQSYQITRKRAPRSVADLPKSTPQAEAFAKQLKAQGYRFVGPASVYAFMQNVGVVNDHVHGCFRATDYPTTAGPF